MGKLLGEALTRSVIGAFYAVYNTLKFGFLESIYAEALTRELVSRGHTVEREVMVPVFYKGAEIGVQRIDMLVDGTLVLELKSSPNLNKEAPRQLLSYLKATRLEIGLLLHFGPTGARFFRVVSSNNQKQYRVDPLIRAIVVRSCRATGRESSTKP